MAKHLTKSDVDLVVDMIGGWQGKLTWKALCDAYEARTDNPTTRQTLYSHEQIANAYKSLKWGDRMTKMPPSLANAAARIERLERENVRLNNQVVRYEEQFLRWIYNAAKKQVTIEDLNMALPEIDRGRTDRG